ncbi:MAG: nucleoside-diphosphate kinase [Candidatus Anstonellales archaeon]
MEENEQTLIILKPDCLIGGFVGEVIRRFERRGLKIIAMKMMRLEDSLLDEHYAHLKNKPFFSSIKKFMKSAPVIVAVLEGKECVRVVREMCGPTNPRNAAPGTIRGDFSLSIQCNIIHASDSPKTAETEIKKFFRKDELHNYLTAREIGLADYLQEESKK